MPAKGNKCCCCGDCKGVVGCCACACKTLCFSIVEDDKSYSKEDDFVDGYASVGLRTRTRILSVAVKITTDDYGQCVLIGYYNGDEVSRYNIPEEISCRSLSGGIPTPFGTVSFRCAVKARTLCTNCDCLCECLCVTAYENDDSGAGGTTSANVWVGKVCFYGDRYEGSLTNLDPYKDDAYVVIRINETEDPYDPSGTCSMTVELNGVESADIAIDPEFCKRKNFQAAVPIFEDGVEKYDVRFKCAACDEECEVIPNCDCVDEYTGERFFIPNTLTVTVKRYVEVSTSPPSICAQEFSFAMRWRGLNRTQQSNAWYSEANEYNTTLPPGTDPQDYHVDYDGRAGSDCPMAVLANPMLCEFNLSFDSIPGGKTTGQPMLGLDRKRVFCDPIEVIFDFPGGSPRGDEITITG